MVNMKIQDDIINEGYIITNLKERIKNIEKVDLDKMIDCINLDNIAISVFLPKENQEC